MGNEQFQARLDDDFAEEVHEYREERHMSKSETVRKGLRELVREDAGKEAALEEEMAVDATEEEPTRTLRSGTHGDLLSLIQTVLTLVLFVAVVASL